MQEYLEQAFDLIRSEDAIIWAGAGFSSYAGYPNATNLTHRIINKLSTKYQSQIQSGMPLDMVCEQFTKIESRQKLNKILKNIFTQKPHSIEYHRKLASIPHVKTIVTTNYDSLFELGYGDNINVVVESRELKSIEKVKPCLFKIHGDFKHPKSIIITQSDYAAFYLNENNVYWTTIKEKIINSNIVFIGYNFGDINIKSILTSISTQLGPNGKEHYLIAPDFPEYEISDLRTKNVKYINGTGEQFIDSLIENLRKNIVKDQSTKKIGLDTFNKFLRNHDIVVGYMPEGNNHTINHISSTKKENNSGLVSLKLDAIVANQFEEFVSGKKIGVFEVGNNQAKIDIEFSGIKFFDNTNLMKIVFVSRPQIDSTIDIRFQDGFELSNIPTKVFFSEHKILIKIDFRGKHLEIEGSRQDGVFNFSFNHGPIYGKVREELEVYKALSHFVSGLGFTIFTKQGQTHEVASKKVYDQNFSEHLRKYVHYFELLSQIENHFNIRFAGISEISDKTYKVVSLLSQIIINNTVDYDLASPVEFDLPEGYENLVDQLQNPDVDSGKDAMFFGENETIYIYGYKIVYAQKICTVRDAFVENVDELYSKKTKRVRMISKTGKITEQYLFPSCTPI